MDNSFLDEDRPVNVMNHISNKPSKDARFYSGYENLLDHNEEQRDQENTFSDLHFRSALNFDFFSKFK